MPKTSTASSLNIFTQSIYLFTTLVAFFAGVISAPIFMYLSNHYLDFMIELGQTRLMLSLFIFWLILTIIFAVLLAEITGVSQTAKTIPSLKKKSKNKR